MLLPSELARMKLGCRWQPGDIPIRASANLTPPPGAYGRMPNAPRVEGNNDTISDCVETAAANAVQTALARAGSTTPISNAYVVSLYSAITGYRPGAPATDQGTDPHALFRWWKQNPIAGYKLADAAAFEPTAEDAIRWQIDRAGGVMLVVALSVEQQNQREWRPTGTPGSWGYHAVWADSYDGGLTFATSWGEMIPISRAYFEVPGFVQGVFGLEMGV